MNDQNLYIGEEYAVGESANEIIAQAKKCTERGEGKGKAHVFLDGSTICQCEDINLERERMK